MTQERIEKLLGLDEDGEDADLLNAFQEAAPPGWQVTEVDGRSVSFRLPDGVTEVQDIELP